MTEPASRALPRVTRLILRDFRTYPALDLPVARDFVALVGDNGAGKTNLLEALSLFAPGRGLRRAEFAAMAREGGPGGFAVSVALDTAYGEHRLGTGCEPGAPRQCRIDGATAAPAAFSEHVRVVWLTPDLDGLFRGPAGDRRRFLDRLVLSVDAAHGARVAALERALRARNRLLEDDDPRWLDAVERELGELAVAVAVARRETVSRLAAQVEAGRSESPFPHAQLELQGEFDALVASLPAVDAEDRYRVLLREGRARDRAAGRTLLGPQASDLAVRHASKGIPAGSASTGEQKALLIGLVLAHARLVRAMSGIAPLVLLDEVAAHLDPGRRAALFDALTALGSQVWTSGADAAPFAGLAGRADLLRVTPGRVEPWQAAGASG
jgi:DNA replication and repair protein RecF